MSEKKPVCPDCETTQSSIAQHTTTPHTTASQTIDRREFIKIAGIGAAATTLSTLPLWAQARAADAAKSDPESLVKVLFETLSPKQKETICYGWDFNDPERGLLRTRVANNWQVNDKFLNTKFYTDEQRDIIRKIFEGIIQPEWHAKIDKQLEDDAGGYGEEQSIAIFGTPGSGKFEFLMTGRHMTLRCDGNSSDHVAFGGPIFYGHAADGFNEGPTHPGNVFWPQAVEANKLYAMLDGKQQKLALVEKQPREQDANFRSAGWPGIPVTELSSDQKAQAQAVLQKLLEPYRQSDRDEVAACLKTQGGLDRCHLAFYKEGNLGDDQVWDCWRLEGPSFVWYFRGSPHVHVWVNIADDPSVKLNA